jgi:hypothetical protein
MKTLVFLIPFLLFAKSFLNFRPCLEKYSYITGDIPVTKTKSITFNKKNCLSYDPFTGMCVIKSKNRVFIKFLNDPKLGWWAASIKRNEIYVGNFAKDEIFFTPAKLSVKTEKNSVVSDIFCRAIGIGTGDGFIKGDMVNHFVKYGYWGDVGIDVDENMKIISVDPFYVKGVKTGEKILKINSKPANVKTFTKYVILSDVSKTVRFNINGKTYNIKVRKKRYNFSILEYYGIKVNSNLIITDISDKIKNRYYISEGAKIIRVNGKKVSSLRELNRLLSSCKNVTISVEDQGVYLNIRLR